MDLGILFEIFEEKDFQENFNEKFKWTNLLITSIFYAIILIMP